IAVIAAALGLAVPLKSRDSIRLVLMAPVPAAIAFTFLVCRRGVLGEASRPIQILVAATVAIVLAAIPFANPERLPAAGANELQSLQSSIGQPDSVLIAAPSGLQWWSGYFLHTSVRR